MRRRRWLLPLVLATAAPLHAAPLPDDQVKAAFIYNVMLFTHWQATGPTPRGLALCILGQDGVGSTLPELEGRMVGARPLQVRSGSAQDSFSGCDVLYIASSEQRRRAALLDAARGNGLMTVIDCGVGLCASGAVLSLAVEDGRLVFAVDRPQAEQRGLDISAQVLRLARPVPTP